MSIGTNIMNQRKKLSLTQDALAQKLGITNQAVSKWELDQACPDIQLLPLLADILGITIDELFDRTRKETSVINTLPWEDDDTLHVVVYHGHTLLGNAPAEKEVTFRYEGRALNIDSAVSVACGDVGGSVDAGSAVRCGNVNGNVDAGCDVKCGDVGGDVDAGGNVQCCNVGGDVDAGGNVVCQGC